MEQQTLTALVFLGGLIQLGIAAGSLAIPKVLRWPEQMALVRPLTRQVFWTYAVYICTSHVAFGLLATLAPDWLLSGTPLSAAVCGFIAIWWGARLALQFLCFDRSEAPPGTWPKIAEAGLVLSFAYLTAVHGAAGLFDAGVIGT